MRTSRMILIAVAALAFAPSTASAFHFGCQPPPKPHCCHPPRGRIVFSVGAEIGPRTGLEVSRREVQEAMKEKACAESGKIEPTAVDGRIRRLEAEVEVLTKTVRLLLGELEQRVKPMRPQKE